MGICRIPGLEYAARRSSAAELAGVGLRGRQLPAPEGGSAAAAAEEDEAEGGQQPWRRPGAPPGRGRGARQGACPECWWGQGEGAAPLHTHPVGTSTAATLHSSEYSHQSPH